MKKIQLMILAIILAVGAFTGCAPNRTQDDAPPKDVEPQTQVIKAVIQDVDDGGLLVKPIEGLEDIDVIHFNISDATELNISDEAPLGPGTIVTAKIDTAIMESYPPQVVLYAVEKTETDPDDVPDQPDDTQLMPDEYMIGKVISILGDEYVIEVISANLYQGELTLTIPSSVLDEDMPILEGNLIGVYFVEKDGTLTVEKIVFSEPDQVIELDDRERISGYLGGLFPQTVYSMSDETLTAEAGTPFAIALDENCESEWEMTQQDGVTLKADGVSEQREDGSYTHYFGIVINEPGEYELTFIHYTADGDFDYSFNVTVK